MALRPYPGFVGPSYTSQSKIAAYDRTVNWYPERIESGTGTATYVLYPAPGYVAGSNVFPTTPGRVVFALNGVIYTIYGSCLYTTSDQIVLRAQGLSDLSGDVAQIVGNGDAGHQLLLRCDETLYAFDVNAVPGPQTLDPPAAAPTHGNNSGGGSMPSGYFGYAYTFVTATGETTASPRIPLFNPGTGDPFGGAELVEGISKGVSAVTSVNVYRTVAQADAGAAMTAQLKLVGAITNADAQWANPVLQFTDIFTDASLGVNVPTVNTATVNVVALTTIPDLASNKIDYLNGYGLSLDRDRSEVRFSAPFDFLVWDALDVFQRSDAADRWQSMIVHHKEIWLFGNATTSVYYNSDDPDLVFQPITSVFITVGIIAPNSVCVVGGQIMWIGQGVDGVGIVYRADGYTPTRISTHAVEYAFSQLAVDGIIPALTLAEGSTYQENGHVFYELTFPSMAHGTLLGCTWVYDATEGFWHERGPDNGLVFSELDIRGHVQVNSAQYTTSRTSGKFYTQSVAFSTGTDGIGVVRLRRAPHIVSAQYRIRYSHLRVLMETGITTIVPPVAGSDPTIALRWSDDGGQTWGNTVTTSVGATGEYSRLVDFRQLGQARDRIFEFRVSDPVPYRLVDCYVDYSVGVS